ncbi:MAG: hypothetical protein PHY45_11800 [Rhodocyclaceae bacterium]|nr:hypothetical protein [Rhodocyclaceae bacterium]
MGQQLPTRLQSAIRDAALNLRLLDLQVRRPSFVSSTPPYEELTIPAENVRQRRAELAAKGINLREFCAERGIGYQAARELLIGKSKGRRGKAHQAAVALGLKPDPATLKLAA